MRIKLELAYDGTDFSGWAKQPQRRTVQGVVEEACQRILRMNQPVTLAVAGRTDAGVHAMRQVASLDVTPQAWQGLVGRGNHQPQEALVRRLNAVLPQDVRVGKAEVVPEEFDARFSALWRRYSYRVAFQAHPMVRRFALAHDAVGLERLNAAAQLLVGERDFAPFCKARAGATTIRHLEHFSWEPWRACGGVCGVIANVKADAFCHHMVRSIVGACLMVASGRRDLEWLADIITQTHRSSEVKVVAAHGLTLEEVGYPDDGELADQAQKARRIRTLDRE